MRWTVLSVGRLRPPYADDIEHYRGLLPEDLIEIATMNGLQFSHSSESGVLFHLIGALSEFGKLGLTAIGNSRDEAEGLYSRTIRVLDREASYGR